MTPDARRFALRAVGKLVASVVAAAPLVACSDDAPAAPIVTDAHADAALACDLPPLPADSGATGDPLFDAADGDVAPLVPSEGAAYPCCLPVLEGALPADASIASYFEESRVDDPSVIACCRATIEYLDHEDELDVTAFAADRNVAAAHGALFACCLRLRFPSGASCTSWGPPPPPAMNSRSTTPTTPSFDAPELVDLRAAARASMPRIVADASLIEVAQATWRGRMVREYGSSSVFESLAMQLALAGHDAADVAQCRAFADDERHHGVLCGAVVEALGGQARFESESTPVPAHRDVEVTEAALRNLFAVCCLAETAAVALLGAERFEMPDGDLRGILTRIWSDEIRHARFGWRLLATSLSQLDEPARVRLGEYLAVALADVERHYRDNIALVEKPRGGSALGLCDGRASRALVRDVLHSVVLPQLARLGVERPQQALCALDALPEPVALEIARPCDQLGVMTCSVV